MTKVHATETRLATLRRYHTRRGPELRYVKSQAHRLSDELVPPRRPIEPIHGGWREVFEIVAGILVMGGIYVAFIAWVAIASASTVTP